MSQESTNKKRLFGLSALAVDNVTSVFILTFMIFIFGIQAYQTMPKEQFPDVEIPTVYINTPYPGNSAADIENLVTRPIEKEIQSVSGVKTIQSTSIQDFSVIIVEFEADEDLELAFRKIKDAVDLAKSELPTDLDQEPNVQDINLSELPIVSINISGDYTNDELREFAEFLEERLEDEVSEISEVELKGTLDREVKVDVDMLKMEAVKVSLDDVVNAIGAENVTISGGEVLKNDFRRAIRIKGEFEDVEEIGNMIVKSENQEPIYLKDIANVVFGYEDRTSIARSDQLPVISLDVIKRAGENLLNASDKIKLVVEDAKQDLPDDLKISFFNDQSINTRNQVNNLENSIISGVILVVLVLLFFLGTRNALFVGLAIPLSMLLGIMFLSFTGVTMNIVVLFSLILALGLLVDNAIVVVENIYRYMQNGYSGYEAAKYGASEVALPIIASTATTLAAFLPLAFWPGIVGEFMKYMPITLIIVLSSSLFVALVINTVFTSSYMRVHEEVEDKAVKRRKTRNILLGAGIMLILAVVFHFTEVMWARNLLAFTIIISLLNYFLLRPGTFVFQNKVLPWLEDQYDRFIRGALRFPVSVFVGTIFLLFLAIGIFSAFPPKIIFFPDGDPLYVNVFVDLPIGKDIEATNRVMEEIEEKVTKAIEPYSEIVEAVLAQIGENTADPNGLPEPGASPNKARLTVSFVPSEERGGVSTWDIMNEIRQVVRGFPGVNISVDKNANGPQTGKPINIEIQGENIDVLANLSRDIISYINSFNIPGIEELQADVKLGKPELVVNIDREAARRYEISTSAIANTIRTAVYGREASKFKVGEDEYPIMVRLDDRYRNNLDDLLNQKVTFRSANGQLTQVPISSVADIDYTSTYTSIKRKDLDRMITVFSNVIAGYNANEIIAEIDAVLQDFEFPNGYSYEFTGEQQQQAEDTGFLSTAFLVATFLIFLILVTQFNSIYSPFIIILSILFSTIGVFIGYSISGKDISIVFTGVGIISLAGIVVNNAIVLIDYINLLIRDKINAREAEGIKEIMDLSKEDVKESIIKGGATRLRPVLLTAITTVLGLIPLAIGLNINFFTLVTDLDPQYFVGGDNTAVWGPMAWTVIYGLIFATFLTLIVVPSMYWLAYRIQVSIAKITSKTKIN